MCPGCSQQGFGLFFFFFAVIAPSFVAGSHGLVLQRNDLFQALFRAKKNQHRCAGVTKSPSASGSVFSIQTPLICSTYYCHFIDWERNKNKNTTKDSTEVPRAGPGKGGDEALLKM